MDAGWSRAYIGGAVLFALFTTATIFDDYHRHAEPGAFTERMGTAYEKARTFIDAALNR